MELYFTKQILKRLTCHIRSEKKLLIKSMVSKYRKASFLMLNILKTDDMHSKFLLGFSQSLGLSLVLNV